MPRRARSFATRKVRRAPRKRYVKKQYKRRNVRGKFKPKFFDPNSIPSYLVGLHRPNTRGNSSTYNRFIVDGNEETQKRPRSASFGQKAVKFGLNAMGRHANALGTFFTKGIPGASLIGKALEFGLDTLAENITDESFMSDNNFLNGVMSHLDGQSRPGDVHEYTDIIGELMLGDVADSANRILDKVATPGKILDAVSPIYKALANPNNKMEQLMYYAKQIDLPDSVKKLPAAGRKIINEIIDDNKLNLPDEVENLLDYVSDTYEKYNPPKANTKSTGKSFVLTDFLNDVKNKGGDVIGSDPNYEKYVQQRKDDYLKGRYKPSNHLVPIKRPDMEIQGTGFSPISKKSKRRPQFVNVQESFPRDGIPYEIRTKALSTPLPVDGVDIRKNLNGYLQKYDYYKQKWDFVRDNFGKVVYWK